MNVSIDLNVDVGEGINNEAQLFSLVSSCNIACGGHAGDLETMREVVRLAGKRGVHIGAHPSYPDPANFGRKTMDMPASALCQTLKNQVLALQSVLEDQHLPLHHIKPHGALYNDAAHDRKIAEVIVDVIRETPGLPTLYAPFGSVVASVAKKKGVPLMYEVFADRAYHEDLSLVSRIDPKAMITDPDKMYEQVYAMIVHHRVKTITGMERPIEADTVCIHGDNPKAIVLAKRLRERLTHSGVKIR